MLEKSSSIVILKSDLDAYKAGKVSERLMQNWNLSFHELESLIESGQATVISSECQPTSHTCCGKCG